MRKLEAYATFDGPVAGYVHHDGKTGCLFQATGGEGLPEVLRDVAMHIAALKPTVTHVDELDQASVQEERDRLTEEAKATGKPDNIIEKIVDGRMNNFYQEQGVLVVQAFAKDDSKSVRWMGREFGSLIGNTPLLGIPFLIWRQFLKKTNCLVIRRYCFWRPMVSTILLSWRS